MFLSFRHFFPHANFAASMAGKYGIFYWIKKAAPEDQPKRFVFFFINHSHLSPPVTPAFLPPIRASMPPPPPSSSSLSLQGDRALTSSEPSLAASFFERAISAGGIDDETRAVLEEKRGEALLAAGDIDGARGAFSLGVGARDSPSLRSHLGQLTSGQEALDHLLEGIKMLEKEKVEKVEKVEEGGEEKGRRRLIRRRLMTLHCAVADLFMTDLCDSPTAESSAEAAVTSALSLAPPTAPDALQSAASLRLSQRRGGDAAELITKAYGTMKEAVELAAGGGEDELTSSELSLIDTLPNSEFRTSTAKILIECAGGVEGVTDSEATDMAESALAVLESCMVENDEVVETWFLMGCAFMAVKVRSEGEVKE